MPTSWCQPHGVSLMVPASVWAPADGDTALSGPAKQEPSRGRSHERPTRNPRPFRAGRMSANRDGRNHLARSTFHGVWPGNAINNALSTNSNRPVIREARASETPAAAA